MSEAEATTNGGTATLRFTQEEFPAVTPHGRQAPATNRDNVGCELAAEVLRSFGTLRLRAYGTSMLPAVWPGDVLCVRRDDALDALPGDIVLFSRQGRLVAHRVVEVRSQETGVRSQEQSPTTNHPSPRLTLVTRGDSLARNDAPVPSREILGRVIAIERGSRHLAPRQSFADRLASWILSRSDFATRVVLKLSKAGCELRDTANGTPGSGLGLAIHP